MSDFSVFHGPNAGYVLDLYERFTRDPSSVDAGWRAYFETNGPPAETAAAAAPGAPGVAIEKLVAARELSRAIRTRGHTAARLDPLGSTPAPDPALAPEFHGVAEAELAQLPAAVVVGHDPRSGSALDEIRRLREIYSGTIGYEYHHLPNAGERRWLREAIETGRFRASLPPERRRALLERLSQVDGFEKFLHRAFFGQKRFSIEGTDAMVPILDEVIAEAARGGARDVVIGMAHRGRLNVLTHVLGKPYALMVAAFQSAQKAPGVDAAQNSDEPSGDVKYHMGWTDEREVEGRPVRVRLSPNPSHLEFVNPVVVGMTRSAQDDTGAGGRPKVDPAAALAVLIHGDAAFPGQGVVSETFNMSGLKGYTVGGTLHVIANNQVGFTTDPGEARSTRYASDLAKGFEVPVVHVNADDAEACLAAARLAFAFRREFGKDFVIDLVGYRRWGHNEGDEPLFTQPVLYETIRTHPAPREVLAKRLVEEGVLTQADADAAFQRVIDELGRVLESLSGNGAHAGHGDEPSPNGHPAAPAETGVAADRLRELNAGLLALPEGFAPNARLEKNVLQKRREALDAQKAEIDWGHAEALAFASLLADGTPVRITGQDAERGTFSHRHAVLHDAKTGATHDTLASLPQAKASFEVHNSPLSEMAVLGFEYGYSVADPAALVLWEAQFGDFVNGAQVIIDQYLSASYQKWGQTSGLVMLLPHGYEGQGPEHSSARLERFLQLAAEDNLRVVYPTTAAQYFHLLRRQGALLKSDPRPMVVMSPKSLLRHPLAAASLDQLSGGRFHPVLLDQPFGGVVEGVTRLVLCSGKVYADVYGTTEEQRREREGWEGIDRVAVARVEELYPFPAAEVAEALRAFPALREVVWLQEEPRNMGAWSFVEPYLREIVGDLPLRYAGRPHRASPAEGYAHRHAAWQASIVRDALSGAPAPGEGVPADAAPMRAQLIGKRKL
ncbi:MAG TPA: 2-oxoglutarate dehydrogenase E1 component [Longimicrobium sp.]|nr:2-oxoglutarate dehydrogenase E1 component [Longimicrobium sp.]